MRLFRLRRLVDETGTSGTGVVAYGVEFENGEVVLTWHSEFSSINVFHSISVMEHIHGHQGKTLVEFFEPSKPMKKKQAEFIKGVDVKEEK